MKNTITMIFFIIACLIMLSGIFVPDGKGFYIFATTIMCLGIGGYYAKSN